MGNKQSPKIVLHGHANTTVSKVLSQLLGINHGLYIGLMQFSGVTSNIVETNIKGVSYYSSTIGTYHKMTLFKNHIIILINEELKRPTPEEIDINDYILTRDNFTSLCDKVEVAVMSDVLGFNIDGMMLVKIIK